MHFVTLYDRPHLHCAPGVPQQRREPIQAVALVRVAGQAAVESDAVRPVHGVRYDAAECSVLPAVSTFAIY